MIDFYRLLSSLDPDSLTQKDVDNILRSVPDEIFERLTPCARTVIRMVRAEVPPSSAEGVE